MKWVERVLLLIFFTSLGWILGEVTGMVTAFIITFAWYGPTGYEHLELGHYFMMYGGIISSSIACGLTAISWRDK